MRSARWLLVCATTTVLAGACGLDDDAATHDGEHDAFTSADGKADGFTISEAEALAVLHVAGTASEAELKAAGLSATVASKLASYDHKPFDSLAELDAIPFVGPRTADKLLAHAQQTDVLDPDALGRHDVSILVPLPASGDLPWTAAMPGRGGAVLPRSVFDQIGRSLVREVAEDAEYAALRVVGVRLDPCFTVALDSACQPQLRLVFQTLATDRADGTNDGAIHALYNLTAAQLADVVARLRALDTEENEPYQPLGVSPTLRAQGLNGPYAQALGELIAEYCGPATLARMTFMTRTQARQGQWEFGGFHVKAFAATGFPAAGPIGIVGSSETLQVIGNAGFGGINYTVNPGIADQAGRVGMSTYTIQDASAAERRALAAWAARQQSPVETVPDTTDCVSCHVAGHSSRILEGVDATIATSAARDRGPRVISDAETIGDNLRAFGYFGPDPFVSIRTANETAAVLRAL